MLTRAASCSLCISKKEMKGNHMYKLLTPGPLTTSETVKNAMLIDHCTWDQEYKEITQWIRKNYWILLKYRKEYTQRS